VAFCSKCGAQLNDTAQFCVACGAPREIDNAQTEQAEQTPPAQAIPPQNAAYAPPAESVPPQNPPYPYATPVNTANPTTADPRDVEDNKAVAAIGYILFFIPLLVGAYKTSPFAKFHANQATVLFVSGVIYGIAYGILSVILAFIPILGWLLMILLGIATFWVPVFAIIGIVNALGGKLNPLPLIGQLQLVK
jgi:uncharacterized membrane protein